MSVAELLYRRRWLRLRRALMWLQLQPARFRVFVRYERARLVAWWRGEPLKQRLGHCFPGACDCRRPNVEQRP